MRLVSFVECSAVGAILTVVVEQVGAVSLAKPSG
jgi:hypothetical protein